MEQYKQTQDQVHAYLTDRTPKNVIVQLSLNKLDNLRAITRQCQ